MLNFESDYINGCHPLILKRLIDTNDENLSGYGNDIYSLRAKNKIKEACDLKTGDVYFLTGGTQTNQIVTSTVLKPYQGVIAAKTGHINLHEAGAIEYTGHKVIELDAEYGKININALKDYCNNFYDDLNHEHMVFPGMVYISYPTEYGTLYTKNELKELHDICMKYNMQLYIDGARLGYGLMSDACDLTIKDIASLSDIFYIGGTKVGALCGEAVVFTKKNTPEHFITQVKEHGALVSKGRINGVQFDALFTDNLYFEISLHAIEMAAKLKNLFINKGYTFYIDSPTNQQFIILENSKMEELKKNVIFSFWEKYDDSHTVVRFATSWSTKECDIIELERYL